MKMDTKSVKMNPKTLSVSPNISFNLQTNKQALALSKQSKKQHQRFCLKWDKYQDNLANVFDQLLQNELFVDVTLACGSRTMKAHKMILSACSPYFQSLFLENPCQHPTIILRDVEWLELRAAIEFMYKGEVNVFQEQIGPLLRVAEMLKIRGLTEVYGDVGMGDETASESRSRDITEDEVPIVMDNLADIMAVEADNCNRTKAESDCGVDSAKEPVIELSNHRGRSWTPPTLEKRREGETGLTETDSGGGTVDFSSLDWRIGEAKQSLATVGSQGTIFTSNPRPASEGSLLTTMAIDDLEIKPEIAEMIREEEKAKFLENSQSWFGSPSVSHFAPDRYQYHLQSMWQRYWSNNQNLMTNQRSRERGPLKSWRPDTMADAIFSVLKDGLTLSQAARKYDIPYPTFVLYANRVHNMLGPSDADTDLRPKGRGRPQRILLGSWSDDHIRNIIKTVVYRDGREMRDESRHTVASKVLFPDGSTSNNPMRRYENLMSSNAFRMNGGESMPLTMPILNQISRGQLNWNNMTMSQSVGTRSSNQN